MENTKPNVMLIMADQWSGARLGCYGHPVVQTPTLDQIAANGVRFTKAYSECPICIPARRTLMTGSTTRTHGDRVFKKSEPMPNLPTLAECFRNEGYQAFCVGKLHVFPERNRIGFDDVILSEEGRPHLAVDDYSIFLADQGAVGRAFMHGLPNNNYAHRAWHLQEHLHNTNWAASEMCRTIKRRDPTRPAFWTLSFEAPHPPLTPLQTYVDFYRQLDIEPTLRSEWSDALDGLPYALKVLRHYYPTLDKQQLDETKRAYYALCTHVDHQIRTVIGTLREEKVLDNTIMLFCTDHGEMLGDFGLFAKRTFYEGSARIPLIIMGLPDDTRITPGSVDRRLVGLQDVMPTLLDLAGIEIPKSCDGTSVLNDKPREELYGEVLENQSASRMLRSDRYKLIWYPAGNRKHLFDLDNDPFELEDLSNDQSKKSILQDLECELAKFCYGTDIENSWVLDGKLVGFEPGKFEVKPDRSFNAQRGLHYPQPPSGTVPDNVGFPD